MYIKGKWVCENCRNYGKYMANLGGGNVTLFCKCIYGMIKKKFYESLKKKYYDHNSN